MNFSKLYNWCFEHRHPIFLGGLILFFFVPEILDKIFFYHINYQYLLAILIISSILLIQTSPRKRVLSNIIVLILIVFLYVWNKFDQSDDWARAGFIFLFIYFSFITFILFKDIIRSKKVTASLIIGAFTGYFMIGIIFVFIYFLLTNLYPDTLNIDVHAKNGFGETFYFSFITLTTIGYGDFSPTSALGQRLAIMEGLIGQFYLAIVMATIVGKYLARDQNA